MVPFRFSREEWDVITHDVEDVWVPIEPPYYHPQGTACVVKVDGFLRRVRPARRSCTAPLAGITPNCIRLDAFYDLPHPPGKSEEEWWRWLTGSHIQRSMGREPEEAHGKTRSEGAGGHHISRRLSQSDLKDLVDWMVIRRARRATVVHPVFKVPKNEQSRFIMDCRSLNARLPAPGDMGLPSLHAVLDDLLSKNWLVQADGKSYFYQFPLDPEAQQFFGMMTVAQRGQPKVHTMQRLPMGYKFAPGIAQHTSNLILSNVLKKEGDVAHAWVDNFLMGSDSRAGADALLDGLKQVCAAINLELKADWQISQRMTVLGLDISLEGEAHIVPGEKLRNSLDSAEESLEREWTPRSLYAALGVTLYILYAVARSPLCMVETVLGEMRRVARMTTANAMGWDERYTPDTTVRTGVKKAIIQARTARWTRRPRPDFQKEIWSDASESALGVVFSQWEKGEEHVWAFEALPASIFVAELLAAAVAVRCMDGMGSGIVRIDNTAALRALQRGHSSSRAANIILRKLCEARLKEAHAAGYVHTSFQRADFPSRGDYEVHDAIGPRPRHEPIRWVWDPHEEQE